MRQTLIRSALMAVTIVSFGIFSWTLVHATLYASDTEVAGPPVALSSSTPARLIIPSLGIDANVQRAGLKPDGSMGTPSNFTDVAWYKYGTIPGQVGSAVIDGHVDNGLSLPGVFKHLADIKVGADVYVEQQDGSRLHFVVVDIETYPYKDAPTGTIFTKADAARLNLITCDGTWVHASDTYNERLVVFTKFVPS